MGTRARAARTDDSRPSGRHFLKSRRVANELVDQAGITSGDLVVEIGAGTGRITEALAARAGHVVAVELASDLAQGLRRAFGANPKVEVIEEDILRLAWPRAHFRAFGNVPFELGTPILRTLLDDPRSPLVRADLLLQFEVARKRASPWPSRLLSLGWLPWWEFALVRRISRRGFEPAPAVDAGMLRITRRDPALLSPVERPAFIRMLKAGFRRSSTPVRGSLPGLTPAAWRLVARERRLPSGATATELDVFDWVELFRVTQDLRGGRWRI